MSTPARLALFAAGVVVSFGSAFLLGGAIGPDTAVDDAPTAGEARGEGMDHDGS